MAQLTIKQKKDWAHTLYLKENLTQIEISDRVQVSRVTICKWVRDGKWEEEKTCITLTREQQVVRLYRQVAEINKAIEQRPDGKRYADSKEADILGKLSSAIRKMETEVGISEIISTLTKFIEWLRPIELQKAKEFAALADAFIKDSLSAHKIG